MLLPGPQLYIDPPSSDCMRHDICLPAFCLTDTCLGRHMAGLVVAWVFLIFHLCDYSFLTLPLFCVAGHGCHPYLPLSTTTWHTPTTPPHTPLSHRYVSSTTAYLAFAFGFL